MAETTANKPTFAEAFLALQTNLDSMEFIKASEGGSDRFKYKYMDLPSLTAILKPVLRKHKFTWSTAPGISDQGEPALNYCLTHAPSGEKITGQMLLMSKALTPQDQGSAITYARRYSVTAVLDIVADEDDDAGKVQAASTAPANEVTKQNILAMLTQIGKSEKFVEEQYGKGLDDMTATEATDVQTKLKTAIQRKRLAEKNNAAA